MAKITPPIILSIFVVFFLSACNPSLPTPITSPSKSYPAAPTLSNGYPASASNAAISAYPGPDNNHVTPLPQGTLPDAPKDAPETAPKTASISAVLFSYTTFVVLPGTEYFLMPAVGTEKKDVPPVIIKPEPSRGDILASTDAKGNVILNNIPPGNYYLMVWSPSGWAIGQKTADENTPYLIEVKANQRLPLGVVFVSWP